MLAAPVELLKQWLRNVEASGGVLDMSFLEPEKGWEQAFMELLSRLWRLLPGLDITDLLLPADAAPYRWKRMTPDDTQSLRDITSHLCQTVLPAMNSVTSTALCDSTSLEYLTTFHACSEHQKPDGWRVSSVSMPSAPAG